MNIKRLLQDQIPLVEQLLKEADLPYSDIKSDNIEFFGLGERDKIIAVGGVEKYENVALLRSVVVSNSEQGRGYGKSIVQFVEKEVLGEKVQRIYLLTTTAKSFFKKLGYHIISRNKVPDPIRSTTEFASLCPETATCLIKQL